MRDKYDPDSVLAHLIEMREADDDYRDWWRAELGLPPQGLHRGGFADPEEEDA